MSPAAIANPLELYGDYSSERHAHPKIACIGWTHLAFCLAHVPLALAMHQYEQIATLHAASTLGLGLTYACRGRLEQCAYVVAYIMGAEVLWRMTDGSIAWEMGKYATTLILLGAMLVRRLPISVAPSLYFAVLLPSAVLTFYDAGFEEARKQLSFNLSGPLALAAAVCFFSRVRVSPHQFRQLLLVALAPILGIAAITVHAIRSVEAIEFTTESNLVTSGGFGPNQVSSALGLGAVLAFVLLLQLRGVVLRSLLLLAVIVLATQSMMTFSRNGIYLAAASVLALSVVMARDRRARFALLMGGTCIAMIMAYLVLPRLDEFTEGKLSARFMDTGKSGRGEVFQMQLDIWKERPILGVGPGLAKQYQQQWFKTSLAAHTEFSRMLSEHGMFGFLGIAMLIYLAVHALRHTNHYRETAFVAAVLVFSGLYLYVNAMRIVAPSVLFGLAFVRESAAANLLPLQHKS